MQYVCSGMAVFEENIAADEGKWTFCVFYALLCHLTQTHCDALFRV